MSNELISSGWEVYRSDNEFFRDEKHQKMTIFGPPDHDGDPSLPNMYLIHAVSHEPELPENFAADLCRDHFEDYIVLFEQDSVPADVERQAAMTFLEQSEHPAKMIKKAYDHMLPRVSLETVRAELLLRFAQQLRSEPASRFSFKLFSELAREIVDSKGGMPDCIEQIKTFYADQICYLDFTAGTNGVVRGEVVQKGIGITDRPKLILFWKDGEVVQANQWGDPLYLVMWVESTDEEGSYRIHKTVCSGKSNCSELTPPNKANYVFRSFTGEGTSEWSDRSVDQNFSLESETDPWDFALVYSVGIDPESNEITIEAVLNENEPEKISGQGLEQLNKL